jgi:peptide-methionine (S)-S-oxide reductase
VTGTVRALLLSAAVLLPWSGSGLALPQPTEATAVLAGGCFWGVEAVFEHVGGVRTVTSGYARYGGAPTRRLEAIRIVYDPAEVTYRQLLEVFFLVAHDPTSRDRQGPDVGPEYRGVVLYQEEAERAQAARYIAELTAAAHFRGQIVTEVRALEGFTVAEASHQDFAARNPNHPYVLQNDVPKLVRLQQLFPALYQTPGVR